MPSNNRELPGSHRDAPTGLRAIGRVPTDESITVSLYLKPRDGDAAVPAALSSRAALRQAGEADNAEGFTASPSSPQRTVWTWSSRTPAAGW